MRRNWFTTVGGIMSGFLLIPAALGTAHVHMPSWLYIICIFVGTMGPVIIGVGAQGQSEPAKVDPAAVQKMVEDHLATMQGTAPGNAAPAPKPQ